MTDLDQMRTQRDFWEQAAAKNGELYSACENQRDQAREERDGAYRERAQLVALLAALYPAVLAPAPDVDEPGWQILYLTLPTGQASWHIHPRDADLYQHVEHVQADDQRAQWDGHTTEEKYQRIAEHITEHVEADRYWAMINALLTEQQAQTLAADLRAGRVKRRKARLLDDVPAAREMTDAEAAAALPRVATDGIDTTGCDCGHEGMGVSWHRDYCAWRTGEQR